MVNKQDFMNAINQNIEMVRGDTLAFNFTIKGLTHAQAADLEVTFAVAEHYDDAEVIILTKNNGISLESYNDRTGVALFSVTVSPDLTKTLDLARYFYDLQIKDSTNVVTLMRGFLTLVFDVAD